LSSTGTYKVRARVTDLAGNEATTASKTFTVSAVTSYSTVSALVRTSDPADGMSAQQLGNVQLAHPLDLDKSPGSAQAGNPALVYNSSSVSAKPVIQATIATPNNASLPSQIGIQLTWNGSTGSTVNYNTTGFNP